MRRTYTYTHTSTRSYNPFGRLLYAGPPPVYETAPQFLFSTKLYESHWQHYYYGYRYYSPDIGRWLSRDPIGEDAGQNLYLMAANAPHQRYDLMGLLDCPAVGLPFALALDRATQCKSMQSYILARLKNIEDRRAARRFFSGTGKDINLTAQEMDAILRKSAMLKAYVRILKLQCQDVKRFWYSRIDTVSDSVKHPWAGSIGGVSFKITSTCACGCLRWSFSLKDRYDFDPRWIKLRSTHRSASGELKTTLMWLAQNYRDCGWKEFYHVGTSRTYSQSALRGGHKCE